MFALTIFTTIVFFIAPVFQIMFKNIDSEAQLQAMEWEVFGSQVKKEIRMSSRADVVSGRLVLIKNNESIFYEKYQSNLRRRVNSTGHEIILQNVFEVNFVKQNNSIKISVIDVWGKEYSLIVHSYVDWLTAI
ncbi:competence protein comGF [Bacillus sp. MRMR6]|nr:competence protein comGF [Bacillus sp. MRMR6]